MAKRRKKKKRCSKVILTTILSTLLLIVLLLLLFHVKQMEVRGIVHSSKKEVIEWIKKDKFSANGIYVWWKCKYSKEPKPAAIDKVSVQFKKPWSISIKVVEKKPIGYIDAGAKYLYFTNGGIAIYKSDEKLKDVSYIEGMELQNSKVKMGKKIPAIDEKVFQRIVEVSEALEKLKLKADRVVCSKGGINLYFSGVEVLLGKNDYDMKLAQLPPILKILKEKYSGLEGTLYLEHYETIERGIRFVPINKENSSQEETQSSEEESFENTEVIEYTTDQVEE